MTIITIRAGRMAADSLCSGGGITVGWVDKWVRVPAEHGGGIAAGCGAAGNAYNGLQRIANGELPHGLSDDDSYVWLRANGSVWYLDTPAGWYPVDAEFFAIGSGRELALGAMAAGATAKEAAEIAVRYDAGCGGRVVELALGDAKGEKRGKRKKLEGKVCT